jgi:C-terminal processing protease CtpA/Prc
VANAEPALGLTLDIKAAGLLRPSVQRVTVRRVTPGSPAARAGLLRGDEITSIDGMPVAGMPAARFSTLMACDAETRRRVVVARADGTRMETALTRVTAH